MILGVPGSMKNDDFLRNENIIQGQCYYSGCDDGGFDLSSKGKKPVPDDDDEEENSDAEEAEIWKVRISVIPMVVQWLTLLLRQ